MTDKPTTNQGGAPASPVAVALLRCSTDEQDLDHQRRAAVGWARVKGLPLDVREEAGISGVAAKRPVLEGIMADARAGGVAALWVREMSRLGRSLPGVVARLHELCELGVQVHIGKSGMVLDYSSPFGRFQAQLLAAIAELEREIIVERTRSGMEAARARGSQIGRTPLRWDEETDAKLLALVADGLSSRKIAASGEVLVWRREKAPAGSLEEWTERASVPSRESTRRRIRELS